jgi:hypothetical protein
VDEQDVKHENRDEQQTPPKRDEKATEAGQEARRGVPPGEHDREHQSQYGGGGKHGGA